MRGDGRLTASFGVAALVAATLHCQQIHEYVPGADDAGVGDAGVGDAGVSDAGVGDAGVSDAGVRDAGVRDAGVSDAGVSDAGVGDAGMADSGSGDAGLSSSPVDLPGDGGCVQAVSLAVDGAGRHGLAYFQGTDVLYAECGGGCGAASAWSAALVQANVMRSCLEAEHSLTLRFLPTGEPAVAYVDSDAGNPPVIYAVRAAGTWASQAVGFTNNPAGVSSRASSMTLVGPSQLPAIAFHSQPPAVQYTVCGASCASPPGAVWSAPQFVDQGGVGLGRFLSMAADPLSGLPRIAYAREAAGQTQYATCAAPCAPPALAWSVGLIDQTISGYGMNLAFSGATAPELAYFDNDAGVIFRSRCTNGCDVAAASIWTQVPPAVAGLPVTGYAFAQLSFDSAGFTRLGYFDSGAGALKYLIDRGAQGHRTVVVDTGLQNGHLSFALTPSGTDFAYSMGNRVRFQSTAY